MFLTADELSQYTGYKPNQRARMCRWLESNGVKYKENSLGYPSVLRSEIEHKNETSSTPNLAWLRKTA